MEILPGKDKVITSVLDAGVDPASTATPPAHFVDTKIKSFTDPTTGTLTMLLKSTGQGDEDELVIIVDPGGAQEKKLGPFKYVTTVP